MSLLMDALRKAEEEKRRAALERKGEAAPSTESDHLASTYPPEGASEQNSQTGEHSSSELRLEPKLEPRLEPMEGSTGDVGGRTHTHTQTVTMTGGGSTTGAGSHTRTGSTTGAGSTTGPGSATMSDTSTGTFGDTTRMRISSAQKDVFDALGVPRRNESTGTFDTLRDPESTIPSKRMLKKSLEEYFESTRSIEGSKIEVALAEQAAAKGERTRETTLPPISDSGPITAQTVFAAKRRSGSSTLFSAAASLLLMAAAGLAAVGGYHWYQQSKLPHGAPSPALAQSAEGVETTAPEANYNMPPVPAITPPVTSVATEEPAAASPAPATASAPQAPAAEPAAPTTAATPPTASATAPVVTPPQSAASTEPTPTHVESPASSTAPAAEPAPPATPTPAVVEAPTPAAAATPAAPEHTSPATPTPSTSVAMVEPPTPAAIENLQASPPVPKSSLPKPKVSSVLDGSVMPGEIRIKRTPAVQPFVPGQVQEAYDAYQHGDYNRAETLYRVALNRYPGNRDALRGIAAVAWRRGDRAVAADAYNRLLRIDPEDATARAGLLALQKDKNAVADESGIKLLLQRDPESAALRSALGNIYARQQRWSEAQQSYFEAFTRDKQNPDLAYNLAVSLDHIGEQKSALDYYRKAVELSGKTPARFAAADVQSRIQALSASGGSAP